MDVTRRLLPSARGDQLYMLCFHAGVERKIKKGRSATFRAAQNFSTCVVLGRPFLYDGKILKVFLGTNSAPSYSSLALCVFSCIWMLFAHVFVAARVFECVLMKNNVVSHFCECVSTMCMPHCVYTKTSPSRKADLSIVVFHICSYSSRLLVWHLLLRLFIKHSQ